MKHGIIAYIFRDRDTGLQPYNLFRGVDAVTMLSPKVNGVFDPTPERPAVVFVEREICGRRYVHAEPVIPEGMPRPSFMFGGTIIHTSDSRMSEMTGEQYPIKLHDRVEDFDLVEELAAKLGIKR